MTGEPQAEIVAALSDYLDRLRWSPPRVRLSRSATGWDAWGIRDPAILSTEDGSHVHTPNGRVMYFTGSSQRGLRQACGRAVESADGEWVREPAAPVVAPSPGGWDGAIASTPWPVQMETGIRLYYRGAATPGQHEGIGVADSGDGINFEKYGGNPVVEASWFRGETGPLSMIGVPSAVRTYEGGWAILFEGFEPDRPRSGRIYGAISSDGLRFSPINGGQPLLAPTQIDSWPVREVANPRVVRLDDGWYMLGFNGAFRGDYSLGFAFSKDLSNWIEYRGNPVAVPRGWPSGDPFSFRLEGPVVDRPSEIGQAGPLSLIFMAISLGSENHQDGVIAEITGTPGGLPEVTAVRSQPVSADAVQVDRQRIVLSPHLEPTGFVQAHIILPREWTAAEVTVEVEPEDLAAGGDLSVYLSNAFVSAALGEGHRIQLTSRGVYLGQPEGSRTLRKLAQMVGWLMSPAPRGKSPVRMKRKRLIQGQHHELRLKFERSASGTTAVGLDAGGASDSFVLSEDPARILTVTASRTRKAVRVSYQYR